MMVKSDRVLLIMLHLCFLEDRELANRLYDWGGPMSDEETGRFVEHFEEECKNEDFVELIESMKQLCYNSESVKKKPSEWFAGLNNKTK